MIDSIDMGLFRKRPREPQVHVSTHRILYVPCPQAEIADHLAAYTSMLSPNVALPHPVQIVHHQGWTVLSIRSAIHPWTLHNLGNWLLDTPPVIDGMASGRRTVIRSEPSLAANCPPGLRSGYTVSADPEIDSCLSGQTDDGRPLTIYVPTNDLNNTEPVPRTAVMPFEESVVASLVASTPPTAVLLEDPGHDLNPGNVSTAASRKAVVPAPGMW